MRMALCMMESAWMGGDMDLENLFRARKKGLMSVSL